MASFYHIGFCCEYVILLYYLCNSNWKFTGSCCQIWKKKAELTDQTLLFQIITIHGIFCWIGCPIVSSHGLKVNCFHEIPFLHINVWDWNVGVGITWDVLLSIRVWGHFCIHCQIATVFMQLHYLSYPPSESNTQKVINKQILCDGNRFFIVDSSETLMKAFYLISGKTSLDNPVFTGHSQIGTTNWTGGMWHDLHCITTKRYYKRIWTSATLTERALCASIVTTTMLST